MAGGFQIPFRTANRQPAFHHHKRYIKVMARNLILVGLGGGLGSMARYLCHRWFATMPGLRGLPASTFVVNITGCFIIGVLFGIFMKHPMNESRYLFLITGFCGGFTTFSAFTLEGNEMIREERFGLFLLYMGASVILGLAATWLGIRLTR
jgi:CrcB protein